jgi:Mrp family chromosome partitioning ATPase
MARIRELLRRKDVQGEQPEVLPTPRPCQPASDVRLVTGPDEEIPFVEVGGPHSPVEGSPSVLKSTMAVRPRPEEASQPQTHRTCETKAADSSPAAVARITEVLFQPFPAEVLPLSAPSKRFAPELVALHRPDHPVSEQYRTLTKALARQLPPGQAQVLLFIPVTTRVDATAVLLNVAITLAKQEAVRVALVDANLCHPRVAQRLGLPTHPGLKEVLAGTISLQRTLQETGQPGLSALTAGRVTETGKRALAGEGMRGVLRQLRNRFEWVLIDAPCWDGRPEAVALGAVCDAVYLVLPEVDAGTAQVEELLQLMAEQGSCVRGCILTRDRGSTHGLSSG